MKVHLIVPGWRWLMAVAMFLASSALTLGQSTEPSAKEHLSLRVELSDDDLEFGRPFQIVIEKRWSDDLAPLPDQFEQDLAFFAAKIMEVTSGRSQGQLFQRLVIRAYALGHDQLILPRLELRARPLAGGEERQVWQTPKLIIRSVASALDAKNPGPAEVPEAWSAISRDIDWVRSCFLAALIALGLGGFWQQRRRWIAWLVPRAPQPNSLQRAEARLSFLRSENPPIEIHILAGRISAILRQYLSDEHGVSAMERTVQELADGGATSTVPPAIIGVLQSCDSFAFSGSDYSDSATQCERDLLVEAELSLSLCSPWSAPARQYSAEVEVSQS